jgi:hypothetical protein
VVQEFSRGSLLNGALHISCCSFDATGPESILNFGHTPLARILLTDALRKDRNRSIPWPWSRDGARLSW